MKKVWKYVFEIFSELAKIIADIRIADSDRWILNRRPGIFTRNEKVITPFLLSFNAKSIYD